MYEESKASELAPRSNPGKISEAIGPLQDGPHLAPATKAMFTRPAFAIAIVLWLANPAINHAQQVAKGLAWEATGNWHIGANGQPVHAGELLSPGTLLTAIGTPAGRLVVLMPDGQRLFLECHDQPSCAQGFRLPALAHQPDEQIAHTFEAISRNYPKAAPVEKTLLQPVAPEPPNLLLAEDVLKLQSDGTVNIAPSIASLPPGDYRVIASSGAAPERSYKIHQSNSQDTLNLAIPSPGLYRLDFYGTLGVKRFSLSLLVIAQTTPPDAQGLPRLTAQLRELRTLLLAWNQQAPGWPIHQILNLFLQDLARQQVHKG